MDARDSNEPSILLSLIQRFPLTLYRIMICRKSKQFEICIKIFLNYNLIKMNIKTLLFIIITVLISNYAFAELSFNIQKRPGDGPNNCRGKVSITASGTAGPFIVRLIAVDESHMISQSNVNGTTTIQNLCKENYDVYAINKFGCDHFLGELIFDQFKIMESTLNELAELDIARENAVDKSESSIHLNQHSFINNSVSLSSSPNPFSDIVNIEVTAINEGKGSMQIYSSLGDRIYSNTISYSPGKNKITIDKLRNAHSGMYIIHFRSEEIDQTIKIIKN